MTEPAIGDHRGADPNVEIFDGASWVPLGEAMSREEVIEQEFTPSRYVLESVGETVVSRGGCFSWTPYRMRIVTDGR